MKKSIKIALYLITIGLILALTGYAFDGAKSIYFSNFKIHVGS